MALRLAGDGGGRSRTIGRPAPLVPGRRPASSSTTGVAGGCRTGCRRAGPRPCRAGPPRSRVPRTRLGARTEHHRRARGRHPSLPLPDARGPTRWCAWRPAPPDRTRPGWTLTTVEQPCVSIAGVAAAGDGTRAYVLGATPSEAHCVLEIALGSPQRPGGCRRTRAASRSRRRSRSRALRGRRWPSARCRASSSPRHHRSIEPEAPPPLVVFCHGGPTGASEPGFDPVVQFFTSRGLAVAAVDYRGSSGYGRAYRERLAGEWGVADVDDCVAFAQALATEGLVDGDRMAIRGTSAGGLTALGALVRPISSPAQRSGTASPTSNPSPPTPTTSSRATSTRWSVRGPAAAPRYRERSPIHHADRISGRGPAAAGRGRSGRAAPDQAVRFAERLREHGVDCRLVVFEGESHGFRSAADDRGLPHRGARVLRLPPCAVRPGGTLDRAAVADAAPGGRPSHRGARTLAAAVE